MTIKTAQQTFSKYITGMGDIELPSGGYVDINFFVNLFREASDPPTYAELSEIDGGSRGYADFFSLCKEEGLIS